jgi:hypothetical protein
MKLSAPTFIIALCLVFTDAAGAQTLQTLRGHVPAQAARAHPVAPLPGNTMVDLVIGLPVRNSQALNAALAQIYDPGSPQYRKFLTPSQFNELYAPSPAAYRSLIDFVRANKLAIVNAPANHKFVHVRAPASVVNTVFHVKLQQYQHPTEKRLFYAPDTEPAIQLETPVSHISGLDNFHAPGRFPVHAVPANASGAPMSAGGSGSGGAYTGKDFRAAYAPGVSLTGRGQAVGILELDGYNSSDIQTYEKASGFPAVPLQNVYLDGYAGGSPNLESAADIELVISMAPGLSKAIVYGAPYSNAGVHDILNEMANPSQGEPLPAQISTSYYFFYDKNVYDALHQLAAQGQALFVASGDFGSYDEVNGSGAFPPADHPYVTSVGSTVLQTAGPGGAWSSETTASFSGGGHSPWGGGDPEFAIPSWQQGVNYNPSGGSTTIRNAPDVAIVGQDISIYFNGSWSGFAGTSASAPLWAGFMALVNEQALASGRPRVGFASPAIWTLAKSGTCGTCFHDIITGNNFNGINPAKYAAVPGYDLATGWGTPAGASLITALVGGVAGWGVVPGGGTTSLPDAAALFQNKIYLFAIGTNDHRHYVNSFDGSAWSGWAAVPGGGTTSLSDTAVALQNRLYLFAVGTNDHRHYVNSFDGATWSGWSQVPGGGTTSLADAATVFKNKIYLFAIGTNDHRHYVNSFDGSAWSGWGAVPGGGTTSLSDTAVALQNRLYLFAVGTNDHRHYVNSFDGATWNGWSQVPGGGTTSLADAAAVFQDKIYLFAVGTNDHHHYMNRFDGTNWTGWSQPAADGKTGLADTAAALGSHLYLFAIGMNDHQHYMLPVAP